MKIALASDHAGYAEKERLKPLLLELGLDVDDLGTMLILYDAQAEIAYFVDLQAYFNENRLLLENVRKFVRIFLPPTSVFNKEAVKELQRIFALNMQYLRTPLRPARNPCIFCSGFTIAFYIGG